MAESPKEQTSESNVDMVTTAANTTDAHPESTIDAATNATNTTNVQPESIVTTQSSHVPTATAIRQGDCSNSKYNYNENPNPYRDDDDDENSCCDECCDECCNKPCCIYRPCIDLCPCEDSLIKWTTIWGISCTCPCWFPCAICGLFCWCFTCGFCGNTDGVIKRLGKYGKAILTCLGMSCCCCCMDPDRYE